MKTSEKELDAIKEKLEKLYKSLNKKYMLLDSKLDEYSKSDPRKYDKTSSEMEDLQAEMSKVSAKLETL